MLNTLTINHAHMFCGLGGGRVNPHYMTPTGKMPDGKKRQVGLEHQVRQVESGFWLTPMAAPSGPDYARATRPGSGGDDLATAVHKAESAMAAQDFFPTPRAADGDKGGPNQKIGGKPALASIAAMFPTPTAQDAKNSTLPPSQRERNPVPGRLTRDGASGQLNPEWVEWLMGFPAGWTELKD